MKPSLEKLFQGYQTFRKKYHDHDQSVMEVLAVEGQKPEVMIVACCDSRVDPALILQCRPGELFVVRNVANIIPPCENDEFHHGTSAALEFAVCYLNVKDLIILGHSQCGGLHALATQEALHQNDFITHWVSLSQQESTPDDLDEVAKNSLSKSYQNCLTFPWIKNKTEKGELAIHRWFFDIKTAEITAYSEEQQTFIPLETTLNPLKRS